MQPADFGTSSPGTLVPTVFGGRAFVPHPLAPSLNYHDLALPLAGAMRSIGELRGACRRLKNPYVVIRPMQRLEAQTSSAIEGTHTTASKLALAEAGIQSNIDSETTEVFNYMRALKHEIERVHAEPITHRTFKRAHATLLENVGTYRGEDKLPGQFKKDQNLIGGRTVETARFIPPPPTYTDDCVSELEKFINSKREPEGALIDIALAHYQFETIHPFADGNGRVGRMLITLMAVQKSLLDIPALFLSPALEGVKDEYIERLYAVSSTGDWRGWIEFFLKTVNDAATRTIRIIDRIIQLQEDYRLAITNTTRSNNALLVVDKLFDLPVIFVRDVIAVAQVTDAGARMILKALVSANILVEIQDTYPKAWIAPGVIEVIQPE